MIIREDAIYGRQSVDRKDSISIESQIEFCKYELRGGNFRKYTDKGYSGKNTDRPKFQEMMADIRRGLIKRVVVYKAGSYQPFHSGLRNHDGNFSGIQCRVRFFHGKV